MRHRFYRKVISLFLSFLIVYSFSYSQQLDWVTGLQSNGPDVASSSLHRDATGVYIAGKFSGTNVDADPGPAVFNISSNGGQDAFVAKYTENGQFLWALTFGGPGLDNAEAISTDKFGNIYITGFFRGKNVDFDPGPGTFFLSSNGDGGVEVGYGGDMFVAKYDKDRNLIWAFNVGGDLLYDNGTAIACDPEGNVYLGAYFRGTKIDFDPSPAEKFLNSADGTAVLAKYDTNGGLVWIFNFGLGNRDNAVFDLKLDAEGNCYATGFFQGKNMDFDFSSAGEKLLDAAGDYETYILVMDKNGNYKAAMAAGSTGTDSGRGIDRDKEGNIYISGDFHGTMDFDPGPNEYLLTSKGYADVFVAKYTSDLKFVAAKAMGSLGIEWAWGLGIDDNSVYISGGFSGALFTFDATNPASFKSNGYFDFYCIKFNHDLNYECGFTVGSSSEDMSTNALADNKGSVYLTGVFSGSPNFSPSSPPVNFVSKGNTDVFLAKYSWPATGNLDVKIVGDTICSGEQGKIKITLVQGSGNFDLVYNDGINDMTIQNLRSDTLLVVNNSLSQTTNYTIKAIRATGNCSSFEQLIGETVMIRVKPKPDVEAGKDTSLCSGNSLQLKASGGSNYQWSPASGLNNVNISNPLATPTLTTKYFVQSVAANGCIGKDSITVRVNRNPVASAGKDTSLCSGSSIKLAATGGTKYKWLPATGLSDPNIANPLASPIANTTYSVTATDENGCTATDEMEVVVYEFINIKASADVAICNTKSTQISATGASDYAWLPALGLSSANISNPVATPSATTSYIVYSPSAGRCSGRDTVVVTVNNLPAIVLTPGDTTICSGVHAQLQASGGTKYNWSPTVGLTASDIANPKASPSTNTTYQVEVTDGNGCSSVKAVTINVNPSVTVKASDDTEVCVGNSVTLEARGASDYQWNPSSGLSSSNTSSPQARPANTTTYVVYSPSAGVCSGRDTVVVKVNPLPKISIGPADPFVCAGGTIMLFASGADSYHWSPSSGLSQNNISNPVAKPAQTINYTVRGTDVYGCTDSATAKVVVGPAGKIYIPNAFTPNNDGVNDCYGINSAIGAESFELAIFNRWGERVFHTTNPAVCWDGRYKGKLQLSGNYAYYLKIRSDCGIINEKGLIALIK